MVNQKYRIWIIFFFQPGKRRVLHAMETNQELKGFFQVKKASHEKQAKVMIQ